MILITVLEFLLRPSNLVSDIPMVPPWRPADVQRDLMKGLEQVHSSKSNDNTMFTTLRKQDDTHVVTISNTQPAYYRRQVVVGLY